MVIDLKRAKEQVAQRERNTGAQAVQSDPDDLLRQLLRLGDDIQARLNRNPRFRALNGALHHPTSGGGRKKSL